MLREKLPFEKEEYQTRLRRVREEMEKEGIEVLMLHTPSNVYYLTGYHTIGHYKFQALLVPIEGELILISRDLERANALDRSCADRYVSYQDEEDPIEVLGKLLRKEGFDDKTIGLEMDSGWLSAAYYKDLMKYLDSDKVKETNGLVTRVKAVKSEREISYMREAARITEKGILAGVEAIGEGKTDNDVAAAVFHGLIAGGSDYFANDPFIAAGKASYRAHANFERRPIRKGDVVFFEVSAMRHRYAGPNMRTAVLGKPSDIVKRAFDASMAALEAALKVARPGVTGEEVDLASRQVIEKAGFGKYNNHRLGYHVGIEWSDQSGFSLNKGVQEKLKKGLTFHMIPFLLIENVGSIGVSEAVLITESGCEVITTTPRELFVR